MFSTTTIIAIQIIYVKRWSVIVAIAFFLFFGFFDGEINPTSLALVPHTFLGLFWVASLKKIPQVCHVPRFGFSLADKMHAGRMGHSPLRRGPDGVHAFLDMGQGTEALSPIGPSFAHLLISDKKTGSMA